MLLPRTHGRRNDHSSDRGVDDAYFRRLSRSRGEKKMLQLVQRVSCAATSSLSMWLRGCCLLVARQEEAALEKTPAEAGRALWYVLHASTARCWWLRSCRRRRRCTNRRRVFQKLMLASGRDGSCYIPCCMCSGTIVFCPHPGYNILCFGFAKCSVDEQMSLRGIGAGSTEESRSGGGGWTA